MDRSIYNQKFPLPSPQAGQPEGVGAGRILLGAARSLIFKPSTNFCHSYNLKWPSKLQFKEPSWALF